MTAKAWSRDARCLVSERTLRVRLREGWPAEKAIGSPAQPKGRPAKVLVEGFGESKSIFGWSKDPRCEVSHTLLRTRLEAGVPVEEAVKALRPAAQPVMVAAFGETKSLSEWARDQRCRITGPSLKARLDDQPTTLRAIRLVADVQAATGKDPSALAATIRRRLADPDDPDRQRIDSELAAGRSPEDIAAGWHTAPAGYPSVDHAAQERPRLTEVKPNKTPPPPKAVGLAGSAAARAALGRRSEVVTS